MKQILLFGLMILFIVGCASPKVYTLTNYSTTIINNSQECTPVICECLPCPAPPTVQEKVCDNKEYLKCNLMNGRLINEVEHLRENNNKYLMNGSYDDLKVNFTNCIDENIILNEKLRKINNSLMG